LLPGPKAGGIVFLVEGYFDESGGLEEPPRIFCVSGYFIASEAAKQMHIEWVAALEKFQVGAFHMVDCAHGTEGFKRLLKNERIELETELIRLIKKYTLEGFSIFAKGDSYKPSGEAVPDAYADCASGCVKALELFLQEMRAEGKIAFFFEKGHASAGAAYNYIAKHIQRPSDLLTFASKQEIPLLQAADLLAWQSCKYAKDYFYPRIDGGEPKRAPRKDFLSLMEHRHTFMHMHIKDGEKTMGVELWPMSMRAASSVGMKIEDDGPILYWREEGDETPIVPIERPLGWRPIGGRMTYVAFEGMNKKPFALCLDDRRLIESIYVMLQATSAHGGNPPIEPLFPAESASIEEIEGQAILRIKLRDAATLAFHIPSDIIAALKAHLAKS
jgi:hypothetical protein